jgi:L-fuconolactonase
MLKIDTHQHFWNYDALKHAWINDEMAVLKRDFLPKDLSPLLQSANINACIAVQADESVAENEFLLALAKEHPFIKGIIAWIDFLESDITKSLDNYTQHKDIKGFRYILQDKKERDLMLIKPFKNNIALMGAYDFVYEILIHSDQLIYANELVSAFPNQIFVLDHLAKPKIKSKEIKDWEKDISALAKNENIYCKLSGMVTEADWMNWDYKDFEPYLDIAFNVFGAERLMFGSDWPVCNLAADYQNTTEILEKYTASLTKTENENFWAANAIKCYHL